MNNNRQPIKQNKDHYALQENPSKHPIIILKDVSYLHLQAILEFMYAGEVNVSQEQLPAFLKTAARLKVRYHNLNPLDTCTTLHVLYINCIKVPSLAI